MSFPRRRLCRVYAPGVPLRPRRRVPTHVLLPSGPVYGEDLEAAFDNMSLAADETYILVASGEAASVADLTDVDPSELSTLQIVSNDGTRLRFRGHLQPWLDYVVDLDQEDRSHAVDAIVGHWTRVRRHVPPWVWTVLLVGTFAAFGGLLAAVPDNVGGAVAAGFGVVLGVGVLFVLGAWSGTRVSLGRRPAGPTIWQDNLAQLRSSWLVIAVSAVLGSAVTLLALLL